MHRELLRLLKEAGKEAAAAPDNGVQFEAPANWREF